MSGFRARVPLNIPAEVAHASDEYSARLDASFSDYARRAESFLTGLGKLGVVMGSTQLIIQDETHPLPNIASWARDTSETIHMENRTLKISAAERDQIKARAHIKGHDLNERIIRSLRLMNFVQGIHKSHEVDVLHDQKHYVFIFYF